MKEEVESVDAPVEGWGRAEAVADGIGTAGRHRTLVAGRAASPSGTGTTRPTAPRRTSACWARATSGCSTCTSRRRLTLDDLAERWPALVPGLAAHEGVGFVAGIDAAGRPWAIGAEGRLALGERDRATGSTRSRRTGARRPRCCGGPCCWPRPPTSTSTARSTRSPRTSPPSSRSWARTAVSAGGRTGPCCWCRPSWWPACPRTIEGADHLHRVLVGMLESLGQRSA